MIAEIELRFPVGKPQRSERLTACCSCHTLVPERQLTDHRRGHGNHPLCRTCADPANQLPCDVCRQPSPEGLMAVHNVAPLLICPCVPVSMLEEYAAADVLEAA